MSKCLYEIDICSQIPPLYAVKKVDERKTYPVIDSSTHDEHDDVNINSLTIPDTYTVVDMTKKHNNNNYVELAGFDDKTLTVMLVPVPEVTYSHVKIDLSKKENSSEY
ncbi:uncharacterized protein [Dysidea avara]|uniref:uncharacterized protein n=1 Tax=Dysidea avara TaxID=196820 RepID=UPI00331DE4DA